MRHVHVLTNTYSQLHVNKIQKGVALKKLSLQLQNQNKLKFKIHET